MKNPGLRQIVPIAAVLLLLAAIAVCLVLQARGNETEEMAEQMQTADTSYAETLFDTSYVHTIDIQLTDGDWDTFINTCTDKEYWACDLVIDGETFSNAAIRAKGNSSMQMVGDGGKYSFKIEFDHYGDETYHGLDKLNLNNMVKDDSCMRDYLVYQMMAEFGVDAPLCSYVFITVNGEDWGLYLALEGVEDAFLARNYGADFDGALYKPDSISNHKGDDEEEDNGFGGGGAPAMGGAPNFGPTASGESASVESASAESASAETVSAETASAETASGETASGETASAETASSETTSGEASAETSREMGGFPQTNMGGGHDMGGGPGGGGGNTMGEDDVKLQYIDDDPDSYPNIFDSAKTDIGRADKLRLIDALYHLTEQDEIEQTVDVEEVLRYFVAHLFVCNSDSYTGSMVHNYYLAEENGQFSMIPWDYNLAFGEQDNTDDMDSIINEPIDTPISSGDISDLPMIAWIFDDPVYTDMYHATYLEFLDRFCYSGWIDDLLEQARSLIADYVARDPNAFCTVSDFEAAVDDLELFCELRAESISGQLAGSIPSTTEGQAAQEDRLIDASELSGTGSGEFGGGHGGGGNASAGPSGEFNRTASVDFTPPEARRR